MSTESEPFFGESSLRLQDLEQSTTDGYEHRALLMEYAGKFRLPGGHSSAWDYGIESEYHTGRTNFGDFTGNRSFARVGHPILKDVRMDIWAGVSQLQNSLVLRESAHLTTLPIGNISAAYNYRKDSKLQFDYGRDFVYQYWVNQVSIDRDLYQSGSTFSLDDRSFTRIRIQNTSGFQSISDGNRSNAHENSILYQADSKRWIWLGWGSRWIEKFQFLHGPRLDLAFDLSRALTLRGYLAANESRDIGHSAMLNHYQQLSLEYHVKKFAVIAEYTGMGDFPHYSNWSRADWRINVAGNF